MRSKFLLLFLLLAIRCHASPAGWGALSGPVSSGTGNPPVNGYNYYWTVTVTGTMVSGTNSNFPVLVSASNAYLKSTSNGGQVTSTNAYDVVFFSNALLTSTLNYETESYSPTTGVINSWVKLPTIQSGSSTVFYMAWGNSSITGSTSSSGTGTWDSNYVLVQHLGNGTTLSASDSTSNGNNGTLVNSPTATAGQIDGGAAFVGSSSQEITSSLNLNGSSYGTISGWIYRTSTSNVVAIGFGSNSGSRFNILWFSDGNVYFEAENGGLNYPSCALSGTGWHYVASTFDGTQATATNRLKAFIDGVAQSLNPGGSGNPSSLSTSTWTTGYDNDNGFSTGVVDETRASNSTRTSGQIATEYNNQSNPSAFLTFGSEQ